MLTVREIISEYLVKNGYDGLCGDDCGCCIGDLIPCGSDCSLCEPAYKHICPPGHEYDFIMTTSKKPYDFNDED